MSEQVQQKKPAPKKSKQQTVQAVDSRPDVSAAQEAISQALNSVTYGAESVNVSGSGITVDEMRQHMKHVLGIPEDAQARVNGNLVDGNYVLQDVDSLEFVKVSGQKG